VELGQVETRSLRGTIGHSGPTSGYIVAMTLPTFDVEPAYLQIWESVWERLRQAILAGEIAAGTKLVEAEMAEQFRVSRGPIRQALRELSREDLVMQVPRRGTFVSTITQNDLIEVYSVRAALEVGAMREGAERATAAELKDIGQAHPKSCPRIVCSRFTEHADHDDADRRRRFNAARDVRLRSRNYRHAPVNGPSRQSTHVRTSLKQPEPSRPNFESQTSVRHRPVCRSMGTNRPHKDFPTLVS